MRRFSIYFILGCLLIAASCAREETLTDGYGYLTASVTKDNSFVEVSTKSEEVADADINFKLEVYNGDQLINTILNHKDLSSNPLQLKTANYTVKASNRDEVAATFDSPRYAGETAIEIKPNTTVNASIKCSLSDVLVAPTFTEDFTTKLKSYELVVSNGLEEGSLVWTSADAGKVGYFKVSDKLDWVLTITNNANKSFDIKGSYTSVKAKQKYAMSFKLAEDVKGDTGAGNFKVVLDDSVNDKTFDYSLDFTSAEAELKTADVWAMFADLSGEYKQDEAPAGLNFEYRKTGSNTWIPFAGKVTVDEAKKKFSARITGLEPLTKYSFRAVCAKEAGKRLFNVETESAEELHNMSFDNWYMAGSAPMPNISSEYSVWDSGSPGSAKYGIIPTKSETEHVAVPGDGKKAARLESLEAPLVGFAAGNIFIGHYIKTTISPAGAKLDWGTPFTSRPLALRGYFDYTPKTIDTYKSPFSNLKGKSDMCHIQVFLTDRTEMYHIDSGNNQFVDLNGDDIIAYGSVESDVATNGYEPFTIKLEYRDLTRKPNMIVIVASASKYGDYFTGAIGSVLYIDEFSFVYDPSELEAE